MKYSKDTKQQSQHSLLMKNNADGVPSVSNFFVCFNPKQAHKILEMVQ